MPTRTRWLYRLLRDEGWEARGFHLMELAETVATAGTENGQLSERQEWVFSQYVVQAGVLARRRQEDLAIYADLG